MGMTRQHVESTVITCSLQRPLFHTCSRICSFLIATAGKLSLNS